MITKSHNYELLIGTKIGDLNDLERCNGHVVCVISPNSVAFAAYYLKVVEDKMKCSP